MDNEKRVALATRFRDNAKKEGIKKGTKAYETAHFYFWYGVLCQLEQDGIVPDAFISISLMSGRDLTEELLDKEDKLPKGVFNAQGGEQ